MSPIGRLTPDQLSSALSRAVTDQVPMGASATIRWGGASQTRPADPAVVITLSAQAQTALDRDRIALQVIARNLSAPAAHAQNAMLPAPPQAETENDAAPLPSGSRDQALLQQYRQMSVADRFYATTDPGEITAGFSPDQKAAFDAAYQAKTLVIRDATTIRGLDAKETWTLTNGPGGGMAASGSFNGVWATQHYGSQYVVFSTLFGGPMLVSWGSQTPADNPTLQTPSTTATASLAE